MRFGKLLLILVGFFSLSAAASAETISVSQKVVVHAQVLPAQYIIIDKQNQITEIDSNSYNEVLPQVYQGSIKPENVRPLTIDLYAQYKNLAPNVRPGVLYKLSAESKPKPTIASLDLAKI
jgi:hypothetical protein